MEKLREDRIMNISTMKEAKAMKHFVSDLSETSEQTIFTWRYDEDEELFSVRFWDELLGTAWFVCLARYDSFHFLHAHFCLPRTTINWSQRLLRNWANWTVPAQATCMPSVLWCHRHLPSRGYQEFTTCVSSELLKLSAAVKNLKNLELCKTCNVRPLRSRGFKAVFRLFCPSAFEVGKPNPGLWLKWRNVWKMTILDGTSCWSEGTAGERDSFRSYNMFSNI